VPFPSPGLVDAGNPENRKYCGKQCETGEKARGKLGRSPIESQFDRCAPLNPSACGNVDGKAEQRQHVRACRAGIFPQQRLCDGDSANHQEHVHQTQAHFFPGSAQESSRQRVVYACTISFAIKFQLGAKRAIGRTGRRIVEHNLRPQRLTSVARVADP
jgi:hypothetical protein